MEYHFGNYNSELERMLLIFILFFLLIIESFFRSMFSWLSPKRAFYFFQFLEKEARSTKCWI